MSNAAAVELERETIAARYCVGIDLGTTNCAMAYVDTSKQPLAIQLFRIPQWVDWGILERRDTLPSFHYELTSAEQTAIQPQLPWETSPAKSVVGILARDSGMRAPGRRIASAKSWLCHEGVDRSAELLPWHGDVDVTKLSPVAASGAYLEHLRNAWDHEHPGFPLAEQDVVITLPASFDEVARELTIEAAKRAGLPRVYLIEEPQAAFYAWIDRHREDWEQRVHQGQLILVCDIGGGTTDFTLIRVRSAGEHQVQFHRAAVGKHLILGGDNLDLALAKLAETQLGKGQLPPRTWDRLLQQSRLAKEIMLSEASAEEYTLSVPTEGARLIGGSMQVTLTRESVHAALIDGFFPRVPLHSKPLRGVSGFQEFGLPYAHDPAVTKHLAEFLAQHRTAGLDDNEAGDTRPEIVLFNGGTMASSQLRDRLIEVVSKWFQTDSDSSWQPQVLEHDRLDTAVAYGAAYFGLVRRGEGIRIAANLGRSYFIQVNDAPPQAMCLIPGSAQPGERFSPSALPLRLHLGEPVQFPIWVSSTRLTDQVGTVIDIEREHFSPLPPICTVLMRGKKKSHELIDVRLETELNEIGTLGLYAVDMASERKWQLQFDIRSTLETDRTAHQGTGEIAGTLDSQTLDACHARVVDVFAAHGTQSPGGLTKQLQVAAELDRRHWLPSLLRSVWQSLMQYGDGRRKSADHEARWLNLVGYCLRPGYGVAVDDWRVSQTWKAVFGQLAFTAPTSRTESLILWRRIAGGLTPGQQHQLTISLLSGLRSQAKTLPAPHELAELWRLAGSLELLSVPLKIELGETALKLVDHPRYEKSEAAILWALGRLGARQLVYGPMNLTIPSHEAAKWAGQLIRGQDVSADRQQAVMQLTRKTEDRYRDCDVETRTDVLRWLETTHAPTRYAELVRQRGHLGSDEEAAIFGEALPLGIRLTRA